VLRFLFNLNLIINVSLRALDTTEKHIVKFGEELKARCKICKIQASLKRQ